MEMVDYRLQLGRLPALRDQDRDVAARRHAEIAMDRFREMKEDRGRARRGEGRGDLAPDMAGLAKAADDQLALAFADQLDRLLERFAEPVGERVERPCLVVQDRAAELEDVGGGTMVGVHSSRPSHASRRCEALDAAAASGLGCHQRGTRWPRD